MQVKLIDIDKITVDRENRQRVDATSVDELADSIKVNGLINPITVTKNFQLIAGERRLEAHKQLGLLQIACHIYEELDYDQAYLVELEENTRRKDLTWVEHNDTIAEYHKRLSAREGNDWTFIDTAARLGMNRTTVGRHLNLKRERQIAGDARYDNLQTFSQALAAANRSKERRVDEATKSTSSMVATSPAEESAPILPQEIFAPEKDASWDILGDSFIDWSANYTGERFNFLHIDFPWGISTGDKKGGQAAGKSHGHYDDSPEVFDALMHALFTNMDNFCTEAAHCLFWFPLNNWDRCRTAFEEAGWVVNPYPLIWYKTDNAGVLPDPRRGPRRGYETALLCTRGDRFVVKAVANIVGGRSLRKWHQSEKPQEVLEHFFRMLVDESTRMLDPTAGSGMAIKVAHQMQAKYALGLEIDKEFAANARINVES